MTAIAAPARSTSAAPSDAAATPRHVERGIEHDLPVSFDGVLRAATALSGVLPATPSWRYPLLDEMAGCEVVVKQENVQPTGAFKVRGGMALVAGMVERLGSGLPEGLVTASTGNHAQSIAYAARAHGLGAVIVMPSCAPEVKRRAVEALGARVVIEDGTVTDAVRAARERAAGAGWYFVSPCEEPDIIHGHATVYLELLREHPDLEAVYVPVGSGSGAAGACLVRDAIAPSCRIIGVQSAQAPAAWRAWREGRPVEDVCTTRASGLAVAASSGLPQRVMRGALDDFILVDDDAIDDARRLLASCAHTLAEGAGAASLAGLLADGDRPRRCAVVVSGGVADAAELADLGAPSRR
ncbi:threonine ammonia-lyase [Actinomyces radicidentis]|uniref:threonine ammonia-lyase n=1 Tax=Actinomyces radicidentis TaxID=111015 RepID=UPI000A03687A|nr:pyridoxal-phosphate dependent enzyme [Actinomyces radicidentis]